MKKNVLTILMTIVLIVLLLIITNNKLPEYTKDTYQPQTTESLEPVFKTDTVSSTSVFVIK